MLVRPRLDIIYNISTKISPCDLNDNTVPSLLAVVASADAGTVVAAAAVVAAAVAADAVAANAVAAAALAAAGAGAAIAVIPPSTPAARCARLITYLVTD